MSRRDNNLYDLLDSLRSMLPAKEDSSQGEEKCRESMEKDEYAWQWAKGGQKDKVIKVPDAKTIVIKNEVNCCPKERREHDHKPKEDGMIRPDAWPEENGGAADLLRTEEAFIDLYLLLAAGATIVAGADVPMNVAEPMRNEGFAAPEAIIQRPGYYDVYYALNIAVAQTVDAQFAVAVNGVPQAKTFVPLFTGQIGSASGSTILFLNQGDVVTIRNVPGSGAIALAAAPSVGAQLKLNLIDRA